MKEQATIKQEQLDESKIRDEIKEEMSNETNKHNINGSNNNRLIDDDDNDDDDVKGQVEGTYSDEEYDNGEPKFHESKIKDKKDIKDEAVNEGRVVFIRL